MVIAAITTGDVDRSHANMNVHYRMSLSGTLVEKYQYSHKDLNLVIP